jgi:DNA-binding transcriptional MerR regulator
MPPLQQIPLDFFGEPEQPQQQEPQKANENVMPIDDFSKHVNNEPEQTFAPKPEPPAEENVIDIPVEFLSGRQITPDQPVSIKSTRGRKSTRLPDSELTGLNVPEDEELFKKQYYPIGEVAQMFAVNTSLIRYWEKEFDIIDPRKNRKGDRLFKPEDIKNLLLIYDLLRRRKFTLSGAKDYLRKNKKADDKYELIQSLQKMKSFLLEMKAHF